MTNATNTEAPAVPNRSLHYRTCPLCEATCGLEVTVEGDTVVRIRGDRDDGDPSAILQPLVRQNRRFGEALTKLTDEQWALPTRCAEWTVRDVIIHLGITNQFWTISVAAGQAGEPTKILANFDPAESPKQLGAGNDASPVEVLAEFLQASDTWCSTLEALSDDEWLMPAEAPPGHIAISAVAHHALWDSWIHERDVFLPMGINPAEETDEISMSLRYVLALGSLNLAQETEGQGAVEFDIAQPTDTFTVRVDDSASVESGRSGEASVITADAVPLLEGASVRAPLPNAVGDDVAWMFEGLRQAFDQ